MKKNIIKAVIFDFDGTLANTEEICAKLHSIIFKEYGYVLTKKQILELRSAGYPLRQNLFKKWFNIKKPEKMVKKVENKLHKYFNKYKKEMPVKLRPGAKEALQYLCNKDIPIVIATSSIKEKVEGRLKELEIDKYVSKVYSTKKLEYGKPEPDIYEYVCFQMNLKPEECLAVEDCPNGIISACEAGCYTIMVPDLTQPDKELKNKYKFKVIKSLKDIKKIVK